MQMKQKIFYRSRLTWRLIWSIGMIFLVLYQETGLNFHWVHLYLFIVGSISLLYSFFPYIIINDIGITFYYNRLFPFRKIEVQWGVIKTIKLQKTKKNLHFTAGARVRAPATFELEKPTISLVIEKDGSNDRLISKLGEGILPSDFYFSDKESIIYILNAPIGGFQALVNSLKETVKNNVLDDIGIAPKMKYKNAIIVDLFIIFAFFYLVSR